MPKLRHSSGSMASPPLTQCVWRSYISTSHVLLTASASIIDIFRAHGAGSDDERSRPPAARAWHPVTACHRRIGLSRPGFWASLCPCYGRRGTSCRPDQRCCVKELVALTVFHCDTRARDAVILTITRDCHFWNRLWILGQRYPCVLYIDVEYVRTNVMEAHAYYR